MFVTDVIAFPDGPADLPSFSGLTVTQGLSSAGTMALSLPGQGLSLVAVGQNVATYGSDRSQLLLPSVREGETSKPW